MLQQYKFSFRNFAIFFSFYLSSLSSRRVFSIRKSMLQKSDTKNSLNKLFAAGCGFIKKDNFVVVVLLHLDIGLAIAALVRNLANEIVGLLMRILLIKQFK